eukprot:COSAG02_NODE_27159_length_616_cov_0.576402_1_plen_65_part_00
MQIEGGGAPMEEASLFRSQPMDYVRMVFPKEAVHKAVSMFGHMSKVQFACVATPKSVVVPLGFA